MALSLLPKRGSQYDDEQPEEKNRFSPLTSKKSDDGLEDSWNADNSGYDSNNPSSKRKQPTGQAENEAGDPSAGVASSLNGAEKTLSDAVGRGFQAASTVVPAGKGVMLLQNVVGKLSNRRGAAIGGGVAGLISLLVFIGVSGGSLYLVHIKERMLGASNQNSSIINDYLQRRRFSTLSTMIRRGAQNLQTDKLATKFRAAGFDVVLDGKRITSVSKVVTEGGQRVSKEIVFENTSAKNLALKVQELGSTASGREFMRAFDDVTSASLSRFSGIVTRQKVYKRLGLVAFIDWIGYRKATRADPTRGSPTPSPTPNANQIDYDTNWRADFADSIANADQTDSAVLRATATDEALRAIGIDPATGTVDDVLNVGEDLSKQGDEYAKAVKEAGGRQVTIAAEQGAQNVFDNLDDVAAGLSQGGSATEGSMKAILSQIGGAFSKNVGTKLLGIVASGADLTTVPREGCRVAGTLEFIKSVRNVMLTIELSKFVVRYFTVADHQKAGLAQSTSVKVMALYLAGATSQSSGMQWMLNGGKTAVTAAGVSKYGIGYADVGILAAISTFLRNVPGLDPENCKLLNNPLTQIGGTIAGGVVAFFSGGTTFGANLGWSISLTLANEIAFAVATPLIISTIAKQVISGYESPEQAGDALASGKGAFDAMTGNANVLLPVTNSVFSAMIERNELSKKERLAKMSIFDRYANIQNAESLVANFSIHMPRTLQSTAANIQGFSLQSILNPFQSLGSRVFGSSKVTAQTSDQCEDSAVIEYDIATDPFCNPITAYSPILDIDQTELVLRGAGYLDGGGQPIGEFADFIENCFSGRTGLLHPVEVSQNGETESNDPTCVVGVEDGPIPGDTSEVFDNNIERVPTKKERFAAWYGYLVDQQTLAEDINDQYPDLFGATEDEATTNNSLYVLGDSLTVGMRDAGSLDQKLREKGWNVEKINALGGQNLQWGIDQLRLDQNILNKSGAVLVGLGTNNVGNYPAQMTQVREQMEEIVNIINPPGRPQKKIYWTDFYGTGTLTTSFGSFSLDTAFGAPNGLNSTLREVTSSRNVQIIPWSTSSTAKTYVPVNDVHPNGRYNEMADFVVNAMGRPASSTASSLSGVAKVGDFKLDIQRDSATSCTNTETPGAKSIQSYVNSVWGGGTGLITSCRNASTGDFRSVHSEGRAVDQFYDARSPDGLQKGNDVFGWLLTNAEAIGIQYIKFWRVQWSPSRGISCVSTASDQSTHANHIHYELNWQGANQQTPYFTSGGVDRQVTINQDICPVIQ